MKKYASAAGSTVKIRVVEMIPDWIIASDEAAYTPHLKTIWLKKSLPRWKFVYCFFHEMGHYFIDIIFHKHGVQVFYDKICLHVFHSKTRHTGDIANEKR